LTALQKDLEVTENLFKEQLKNDQQIILSKQVIIDVIDQDLPWHDSLQSHFTYFTWWSSYPVNQSAYNSIEA
jgi:hypothetical protein